MSRDGCAAGGSPGTWATGCSESAEVEAALGPAMTVRQGQEWAAAAAVCGGICD